MKVVLLLLLFFLHSWSEVPTGISSFSTPKCPKQLELPAKGIKSCSEFCATLTSAVGGEGVESKARTLNSEVGGEGVESKARAKDILSYDFNKHICSCHFYKKTSKTSKDEEDLYEWELTCVYLVELEKSEKEDGGQKEQRKNINLNALPDNVPTRLAHLFLFSRNAFSSSSSGQFDNVPLKIALGGFYSIYARAIESFTYLFALYLVIIVSFWNFLIPGGIAFVRKLREGHVDFTSFVSGELVSRSMVVIPAVAFFSLPVSVGGILSNLPAFSLPKLLNLASIGGVQNENFLVLNPCNYARDKKKCGESWSGDGRGEGIIWKIYTGLDQLKVPLALAVVREFVNFGLASADAAAKRINAVILAYQDARLKEVMDVLKDKKTELQRLQKQHENSVASAVDNLVKAYSECINSDKKEIGCNAINNWNYDKPNCPASVQALLSDLCSQLRVVHEKQESNESQESNQRQNNNIESDLMAYQIKKKFGWLSPAVLPQALAYEYFVSLAGKSRKPMVTAELLAGQEKGEGSWLDWLNPLKRKSIRLDETTAFVFGQALGITSLPPFSLIKSAIHHAFQQGNRFIEGLVNLVSVIALPIPWLASITKEIGGSLVGVASLSGNMVSLYLSYVISVNLLKLLPFFVVSTVAIFRFLGYLFDLAKFVISLPFFAVGAATRNPASALSFFTHTVKLTGVPILIAFMPLVAFVGIELTFFFLYEIPVKFMLAAGVDDAGMLYNFILGVVTGVLYVVVSFISVKVAWELSNGFIEGVFSYVSQLVGHFQSAGGAIARSAGGSVVPGR